MYEVTAAQKKNLEKLAAYLEALPANYGQLDMDTYCWTSDSIEVRPFDAADVIKHDCGSCACVLGHGPSAGIKPLPGEDWDEYALRQFGADEYGDLWDAIFAVGLSDNVKDAVGRIRTALTEIKVIE